MEKFKIALELYEETFDDSFPTFPLTGISEDEIIDIINKCVTEKRDVYDMGFLSLDTIY